MRGKRGSVARATASDAPAVEPRVVVRPRSTTARRGQADRAIRMEFLGVIFKKLLMCANEVWLLRDVLPTLRRYRQIPSEELRVTASVANQDHPRLLIHRVVPPELKATLGNGTLGLVRFRIVR